MTGQCTLGTGRCFCIYPGEWCTNWKAAMPETLASINAWQKATFPNATPAGIVKHIHEEWKEWNTAASNEEAILEAIDLIILLAAWIGSIDPQGAQHHLETKMYINRARVWNILPDGTGRHK